MTNIPFRWNANLSRIHDGLQSGPIVFFDKSGASMVASSFNHFMAANTFHNVTGRRLDWGIMGKVDSVPPGYTMDTIMYYSDNGINDVSTMSFQS